MIFLCWGNVQSGNNLDNNADEINKKLENASSCIEKSDLLFKLGHQYLNIDNSLAEKYLKQAYDLIKECGPQKNSGLVCYFLGILKTDAELYLEAEKYLNEGLKYYARFKQKSGMAHVYIGLGNLYFSINDFENALDYYQKSIDILTRLKLNEGLTEAQLNMASIYVESGKEKEAFNLSSRLVDKLKNEKDTSNLIPALQNLGNCYLKFWENIDSAKYYYQEALDLSEKIGEIQALVDSYGLMGEILSEGKDFSKSNQLLNTAFELANSLKSNEAISTISRRLGENYISIGDTEKAFIYLKINSEYGSDLRKLEATKTMAKRKLAVQSKKSKTRILLFYISLTCLIISVFLIITLYHNFRIKKKANRLLTEMDELKSRLFSNLTHEFRTPLTLILGPLEVMLSEGEKRNLTRQEIKVMRKNAKRLLTLVNQMLDLAKLDAKSMKAELSEGDFVKFFKVHVMLFVTLAEQKGIDFKWMVPKVPVITWFDEDKLAKILTNLVSNAIKYTEKGGEITCVLETVPGKKDTVKFSITDTGKGIRKEHLPRIFDRFYQVEGMMDPDSFGSGIGLSLTRELITLLKGTIMAESEWGNGSKFTVTLPLGFRHLNESEYVLVEKNTNEKLKSMPRDFGEDEKPVIPESEPVLTGDKNLPLVLTVEDQSEIRNFISEHLKDAFRILEAANGLSGFDVAVKYLPDLIITDLVMPEMDGMELCSKLKTDERTSHIPVIMLTARTGTEHKLKGLETGADQYLTKPFHMKELLLLVRKLIEQRNLLRERFSRDVRLEPRDIAITSADERFLNRALAIIEKHMGDFDFEVNTFQKEMAMSRMQLFRKIKALSGQSPTEFIRIIKLKRAAKLIEQGFGNIAQISYEVGFNNPSYFAKCFKEIYGSLPSDYKKEQQKN